MMHESNSPKPNIPETRSKRQTLLAISLGLITFIVTPIVTIVISLPFLLFGQISEAFNPIIFIARISNIHPEYGPIYKKLEIVVPISVSQSGTYIVTAQYNFSKEGVWGNTPMKEITRTFDAKDHAVKIEFLANEAGGNYGYWSRNSVGGNAEIQIFYLISKKEVFKNLKSDPSIDKNILEQFMKDEGMDKGIKISQTINKFVGKKVIQF